MSISTQFKCKYRVYLSKTFLLHVIHSSQTVLFDSQIGPYQMLPLRAKVDLWAMTMKGYSAFPKAPALLEHHHQILLVSYLGHSLVGLTPLQRSSRCILQPKPTGQEDLPFNAFELAIKFWETLEMTMSGLRWKLEGSKPEIIFKIFSM